MRQLLTILFLCCMSGRPAGCLKLDVVLVGDYSSSVHGQELFVTEAFQAFADKLELGEEQVRLGAVIFAEDAQPVIPLTGDTARWRAGMLHLRTQTADGGGTDLSSGLQLAGAMLLNDRKEATKLIVLVSDGEHNRGGSPEQVAQFLRQTNVLIASITIVDSFDGGKHLMHSVASEGLYHETSYDNLLTVLKQLDTCF